MAHPNLIVTSPHGVQAIQAGYMTEHDCVRSEQVAVPAAPEDQEHSSTERFQQGNEKQVCTARRTTVYSPLTDRIMEISIP